jgi:aminobenzoyl-glutamate utilization protein A
MDLGLWAETMDAHDYVIERLHAILAGTAASWDVLVATDQIGGAPTALEDPKLGALACQIAETLPTIKRTTDMQVCRAGEDASVFLNRVAEKNGHGIYVLVGSDLTAGHHTPTFDFDERSLVTGTGLLSAIASHLLASPRSSTNGNAEA